MVEMNYEQRLIFCLHSFWLPWMVITWCACLIVIAQGNNIVLESRPFDRYGVYGGSSNRKARDIRTNQDRLGRGPIAYPSILASNIIEGGTNEDGHYLPPDTSKCPKVNYDCNVSCRRRDSAGCNICDCRTSQGLSHSSSYQSSGSKGSASSRYCFAMVICMLSCKDGYTLGERDSEEGCQTCHCMKTSSAASHSQSSGNVNEQAGDGQDAESGSNYGSFDGNNGGMTSGSATGSGGDGGFSDGSGEGSSFGSGYSSASGFDKGGSGFDEGGSSNAAGFGGMQGGGFGGSGSGGGFGGSGSGGGMNPMFPGGGMGTGSGSSSGSGCSGPFCLGQGGGMGGGAGGGGSGGGFGGGGGGGFGGSGGGGGGGGCTGPFCISGGMSGGGGGGAGGGGGGGGGMTGFSPFMMAASGGAGSGMGGGGGGGSGGGCTGPFCAMAAAGGGMGGAGSLNMGGMQAAPEASSSGDGNCIGPQCSAKDGAGLVKDQSLKNK